MLLLVEIVMGFVLQATVLMALLQPPPETFDLFDDIMLLSDGGNLQPLLRSLKRAL
jgi:hypothetical protein